MSEPFIAQVKAWGGNFAPRGYAYCDGQLLPIAQNTALFSLVGTTYGGDGRTTLGLPDLQGRAAGHQGRGPGLTARRLGEKDGTSTVTLTSQQMPSHSHDLFGTDDRAGSDNPTNALLADRADDTLFSTDAPDTDFDQQVLPTSYGQGAPHDNMQPYLTVSMIIALVGTYPSRS